MGDLDGENEDVDDNPDSLTEVLHCLKCSLLFILEIYKLLHSFRSRELLVNLCRKPRSRVR